MANKNLTAAKSAKNDEFYTRLEDIEKECHHYKEHFRGKTIYCNCDDPRESNFFKYFSLNFEHFGLKKLITTGFKADGHGVAYIYEGDKNGNGVIDNEEVKVVELKGDGDFRSEECVELLKESDIVVTNPPFSMFREYMAQLMEYGKKFLVIGNMNAITYKEIFPLIKENKLWCGYGFNLSMVYKAPYENLLEANRKFVEQKGCDPNNHIKVPGICWFTNLPHDKRNHPMDLCRWYEKESQNYPKYSNYDAIEVSKVCNIPADYQGAMGVPITFLDKYCPEQFEIIGHEHDLQGTGDSESIGQFEVNGVGVYKRILIRNLHPISYDEYFKGML